MRQTKALKDITPQLTLTRHRSERLRERLREINARSEKELAAIFASIEKAKAAFRTHKS